MSAKDYEVLSRPQRPISRVPNCGRGVRPQFADRAPILRTNDPDENDGRGAIYGLYAMLSAVALLFVLGKTLEWPPIPTDHVSLSQSQTNRM